MGLRAFIRRHHNVFSYTTREVVIEPGDEDMVEEEYGERAVEETSAPRSVIHRVGREVSHDEIQDGEFEDDKQPLT